jgi:hypothetical protein
MHQTAGGSGGRPLSAIPVTILTTTDDLGREPEGGLRATYILPTRQSPEYKLVGPSSLL